MNTCQKCRYSNIPANCQYCPMCGSPASPAGGPTMAGNQGNAQTGALGQLLMNYVALAAEKFVQSRVQQSLGPVEQLIQQFTGGPAGPPVPSSPPPAWYEEAYREGQPKMDPTEVARRQAAAQSRARMAAQSLQMAMRSQHESMMSILGNMKS